jgi:hypothetical protein
MSASRHVEASHVHTTVNEDRRTWDWSDRVDLLLSMIESAFRRAHARGDEARMSLLRVRYAEIWRRVEALS